MIVSFISCAISTLLAYMLQRWSTNKPIPSAGAKTHVYREYCGFTAARLAPNTNIINDGCHIKLKVQDSFCWSRPETWGTVSGLISWHWQLCSTSSVLKFENSRVDQDLVMTSWWRVTQVLQEIASHNDSIVLEQEVLIKDCDQRWWWPREDGEWCGWWSWWPASPGPGETWATLQTLQTQLIMQRCSSTMVMTWVMIFIPIVIVTTLMTSTSPGSSPPAQVTRRRAQARVWCLQSSLLYTMSTDLPTSCPTITWGCTGTTPRWVMTLVNISNNEERELFGVNVVFMSGHLFTLVLLSKYKMRDIREHSSDSWIRVTDQSVSVFVKPPQCLKINFIKDNLSMFSPPPCICL